MYQIKQLIFFKIKRNFMRTTVSLPFSSRIKNLNHDWIITDDIITIFNPRCKFNVIGLFQLV
ncbi:hypothetical protein BpHYR1_025127 [Brachionus plicatilis]|uniref:Uncharacterized protein n=1 Tax=Brachionus plicatilis TaxID=10195 RepID=A0A3M7RRT9_BRAPC|nr:hypothetical protein BpHYR1_025127 [Brachionus plicatilis]